MRVLVTGGAGFIGSHVAEHLLDRGHEVAVLDSLSGGRREHVPGDDHFYETDVRDGCGEVFEEFAPAALCHQAAQIDVQCSVAEPDLDAEVSVLGTVRLLQNGVEHGVGKVIFASTGGAIYGEQEYFPADEDHPQYPLTPYGVSKLAGERYLHFYNVRYGLRYAVLRYANVYGPRQDPRGEAGVVAIFCDNPARGERSIIDGTGEQTRDYVYVGDVARANVLALEEDVPGGAYNIGTAIETSVNRLYEILVEVSRKELPTEHGPARPGEPARSCIDPAKAARLLGWRAGVGLSSGLRMTLEYFDSRRRGT